MTPPRIPSVRLDNSRVWEAVLPKLKDLVLAGRFTLGPELEEFERLAAFTFGTGWCVGTASGTSALVLALRAAPMAPRSRVALPANTFFATFEAVVTAGHHPVLVDHDEDYLIDLDKLAELDVDAVIPVHLFGLPVDMPRLMKLAERRSWWVLEDCSQSQGATINSHPAGSFGDAAAVSAYPTKNLGAWGDAGFVVGNDSQVEERIRALRHHGQTRPNHHVEVGGTERLDNIQALVLIEKLKHLANEVERRRELARSYRSILEGHDIPIPDDRAGRRHAYHQFVVRVADRDHVRSELAERGIGTGVHYPVPIYLQPGALGKVEVHEVPRSQEWASQLLSLPIYPNLTTDEVHYVGGELLKATGS